VARVIALVSLTVLKAVKLTPKLVARFALLPLRKVRNPCLYCPGICLASCPTFLDSGNMMLSPLGYSRHLELGKEKCAKCWRCVQECPARHQLPETYSREKARLELRVLREGSPLLVAVEGLDESYASSLSSRLGAGLAVVKALDQRYTEGRPLEGSSARAVVKALSGREAYSVSPEAAHALGLRFLPTAFTTLGLKVKYEGVVHIPCLLRSAEPEILNALRAAGAVITGVDRDSCLKAKPRLDALYLCPRAGKLGLKSVYDFLQ